MQRFFDFFLALIILVILSPIMLIVCLILRFSGEGEVFFLQERIGHLGRNFKLIKFATMLKNSPNIGTGTITLKDDPRILFMGKFLRKTKINELPQILNILKGDMSFVGPRPLTDQTFGFYSLEQQKIIILVKPGLSGVGSIVFRGEEEILSGDFGTQSFYQNYIAPYKGELETWFVSNRNIFLYFLIIIVTAWVVVLPRSKIHWIILKGLPEPPKNLRKSLHLDE